MHGERTETMPQEIVDALEFILSRITWDHAQERLGVARQTIANWRNGKEPLYSRGVAILSLARELGYNPPQKKDRAE